MIWLINLTNKGPVNPFWASKILDKGRIPTMGAQIPIIGLEYNIPMFRLTGKHLIPKWRFLEQMIEGTLEKN